MESFIMRIRIPSKKVCEEFHLTYELKGAQKGVDVLTRYYGTRRMKIILDGRRVGNGDEACYYDNKVYFTKKGLNKLNVLHELYHHVIGAYELDISERKEESQACRFARGVLKKG